MTETTTPSAEPDTGRGLREAFGPMMRRLREAKGLSLQGLADRTGMTKAHMWDLEQGRAANPCVSTITALGRALEVDPVDLFQALAAPSTEPDTGRAPAADRNSIIEECAVAAEAQDRAGYEWVRDSLWAKILKRAGDNVRKLKS